MREIKTEENHTPSLFSLFIRLKTIDLGSSEFKLGQKKNPIAIGKRKVEQKKETANLER